MSFRGWEQMGPGSVMWHRECDLRRIENRAAQIRMWVETQPSLRPRVILFLETTGLYSLLGRKLHLGVTMNEAVNDQLGEFTTRYAATKVAREHCLIVESVRALGG